jgi:hypothetical protein
MKVTWSLGTVSGLFPSEILNSHTLLPAWADLDGRAKIWVNMKTPFSVQLRHSRLLVLPTAVHVVVGVCIVKPRVL